MTNPTAPATARLAAEGDIEILLPMMQDLYDHDGVPFQADMARRGFDFWLEGERSGKDRGQILVLEAEGRVVGYMVLAFDFSLEFGGLCTFIDELYLREEFRGRGWGSWAVKEAIAITRQRGGGAVLLEAAFNNPRATELYSRLGFAIHERRLMSVRVEAN